MPKLKIQADRGVLKRSILDKLLLQGEYGDSRLHIVEEKADNAAEKHQKDAVWYDWGKDKG